VIALLDNTVLSNFAAVERSDLIRLALGSDVATPEAAWGELQAGVRIGKLPAQDWSWLPVLSLTEEEESLYDGFSQYLNAGEAACLAVAVSRKECRIFTDDRDARDLASEWRVPVSGTLGILLRLIDLHVLSLSEANALLSKMIAANNYRSPVDSLADLL
jgi:predicted nucleic acid-binding protein